MKEFPKGKIILATEAYDYLVCGLTFSYMCIYNRRHLICIVNLGSSNKGTSFYSSLHSVAVINMMTRSNMGRIGLYQLTGQSPLSREAKTGTPGRNQGQELKQRP